MADAYPNPFNPETEIGYALPAVGHVQIKIFDALGKAVATLVDEMKQPSSSNVRWQPSVNASGVYFCRMNAGSFSETKKLVLLK